MRTIIRRLIFTLGALFMAAGLSGIGAVAASASPPPVNHCALWANYHLYGPYPHCYANETPADLHPHI